MTDATNGNEATGRVTAMGSAEATTSSNCGYLVTITAAENIMVELDTDNAFY